MLTTIHDRNKISSKIWDKPQIKERFFTVTFKSILWFSFIILVFFYNWKNDCIFTKSNFSLSHNIDLKAMLSIGTSKAIILLKPRYTVYEQRSIIKGSKGQHVGNECLDGELLLCSMGNKETLGTQVGEREDKLHYFKIWLLLIFSLQRGDLGWLKAITELVSFSKIGLGWQN